MLMSYEKIKFEPVKRIVESEIEYNIPAFQTSNAVACDFEAIEDMVIPSLFGQVWEGLSRLEPPTIKPYLVRTGLKATFPHSVGLFIANRSGGPKRGLVLANSIGVIDADYYSNPDNDGEIMFAFYNFSLSPIHIRKGERIGQGWFARTYKAQNSPVKPKKREGGFNSTGKI